MVDQNVGPYDQLIERITIWAEQEENVRAAIIIGSQARADHPADEWSDLDVFVLARDPERYWQTKEWLNVVGTVWLSFVEPSPDGRSMEHRVLFSGGLDVDFAFSSVVDLQQLLKSGVPPDIASTIRRGTRIVVDKDKLAAQLLDLPPKSTQPQLPAAPDFLDLVHNFWYHTLWTAKHLRRGELWWAKACCDMHLKLLLQKLLEWHALATQGQQPDTWQRGRFLEEWADPRAVADLSAAFAHYNAEDIWRALLVTMDLFAWLERETAAGWHFVCPPDGEIYAAEIVNELFHNREVR